MIVERCGCGATIAVDVPGTFRATEERKAVAVWRAEHVHTATPSDCASTAALPGRGVASRPGADSGGRSTPRLDTWTTSGTAAAAPTTNDA